MSTLWAYVAALLVLLAAVLLSIHYADGQWLSRSGSLIVVIGMFLTSRQVLQKMRVLKRRSVSGGIYHHDWAKDGESMAKSRVSNMEVWASERSGFYLLVFGTLVWGFGDLLFY